MTGWLLFHLLTAATGAWLARRYALRRNLVDQPGERRSHRVPTPRSGGIGIVIAVLAGGAFLLGDSEASLGMLVATLLGFAAIAAIGLIDDHRPLSPWPRLVVHAVASVMLAAAAWFAWQNPWFAIAAFALAMVLTNVWNFMDGIDGIATTQAMLVAGVIAYAGSAQWVTLMAAGLLAASLGFLPFNFPKARLFLGDVGSGAIGFLLAALLLNAMAAPDASDLSIWLLLPSAFLVDATCTLGARMLKGDDWWRPHALHAYQGWARRAGSHVPVTLAYAGWTVASIIVFLGLRGQEARVMLLFCTAWYTAATAIWWVLQGRGMQSVLENRE